MKFLDKYAVPVILAVTALLAIWIVGLGCGWFG